MATRKFNNDNVDVKAFDSEYFLTQFRAIESAGKLSEVVSETGDSTTVKKYTYRNLKFTNPLNGKDFPTMVECASFQAAHIKSADVRESSEIPLGLQLSSNKGDAFEVMDYISKAVKLFNPDIEIKFTNTFNAINKDTGEENETTLYYVSIRAKDNDFSIGTEINEYKKNPTPGGKPIIEPAKVDGEDISPNNIHEFITYNSKLQLKIMFGQYRQEKGKGPEMVMYTKKINVKPAVKTEHTISENKKSFMDDGDDVTDEVKDKIDDLQF